MVGSGFSRNGEIKLAGRPRLPDWDALGRAMRRELHPEDAGGGTMESLGSADPLAIAQDYSDEFGRPELHRFLRDQIRDDEVEPGEFHRRLLALPWSDVFTDELGYVAGANGTGGRYAELRSREIDRRDSLGPKPAHRQAARVIARELPSGRDNP